MSETQITTTYGKDRNGRYGRSRFRMDPNLVADIETSKRGLGRSGLISHVTVSIEDGSGFLSHRISYPSPRGDFSKRYITTTPSRVTDRVVREQHEQALSMIDQFRSDIKIHYKRQAQLDAEAGSIGEDRNV